MRRGALLGMMEACGRSPVRDASTSSTARRLGFLRRRLGRQAAEDAFQETFLRALRAYARLHHGDICAPGCSRSPHGSSSTSAGGRGRSRYEHPELPSRTPGRPTPRSSISPVVCRPPNGRPSCSATATTWPTGHRAALDSRRSGPPGGLVRNPPAQRGRIHDGHAGSRRRFRDAAAAEGLLDVGYDMVDSPIGPLLVAATAAASAGSRSTRSRSARGAPRAAYGPRVLRSPERDSTHRQLDEYFGATARVRARRRPTRCRGSPSRCSTSSPASRTARHDVRRARRGVGAPARRAAGR